MGSLQEIVNVVNNNKGDITLYRIIFNVLTDTNSIKNYTNNNNGIFFNMNSFDSDKIKSLYNNIHSYIDNKNELEKIESNRENIMKELSKSIDNSYKTELKDLLDSNKKNKSTLSTHIGIDSNLVDTVMEKTSLKKKNNQRMKKSIENYQKPVIYKGPYERIKRILNQSKSTRTSKNTSIEESDRLYDSEESVSVGEGSVYNSGSESDLETEPEEDLEPVYESDQEPESSKTKQVENIDDDMKDLFGSDSD